MFILYASIVWTCLFRFSGIPVPRDGAEHAPHFFFIHNPILMKKIKLYISCSIDGYIADLNGSLDWLSKYPMLKSQNTIHDSFIKSIDSVIMGGKSFRDILNMDFIYPYENLMSYILTHNTESTTTLNNVRFISDNIIDTISTLKTMPGKDIWLVGGGETLAMLLENNLVDQLTINQLPMILGDGIPLFPKIRNSSQWRLIKSTSFYDGTLTIEYQKIASL
mgnify:CR=1 FL=1